MQQAINGENSFLKDSKERATKLTAAAMIALGALTLSACSSPEVMEPSPPTAQPTETEEPEVPAWFHEENIMERSEIPAELVQYQEMSVEDFINLPKAEQWLYVSWLTQYRDEFEAWSYKISASDANLPTDITPESGALDLMRDRQYTMRMAAYATEGTPVPTEAGTCGRLDEDDVRKITAAATIGDYLANEAATGILTDNNGLAICPSKQAVVGFFDTITDSEIVSEERYTTGAGGQEVTVNRVTYNIEGTTRIVEFFIFDTVTFDGQQEYHTAISRIQ